MLPGGNGLEVLESIRQRSDIPVLMLTAKGDEMDRINSLEIGADDYLPKPCNPRELTARLRSTTHRGRSSDVADAQLEVDDLLIDCDQHQVLREAAQLDLIITEFHILGVLAREA